MVRPPAHFPAGNNSKKEAKMTNNSKEEAKAVTEENKCSNVCAPQDNVCALQDEELDVVTGGVRTYGPINND
jgi:hypothetical protein